MKWDMPPAAPEFVFFGEGMKRLNNSRSTGYRDRMRDPNFPKPALGKKYFWPQLRAYYVSLARKAGSRP